ncbi:MAG: calcium-binding protein, partial [Verrucomicrobiaceae bacterium]|nr:calcium-binding protein [Verrucomicrobiaceae bacterium]
NNSLFGNEGDDDLFGGSGEDNLFGGDDDDRLDGGEGNDSLFGGAGDDDLIGGPGDDLLNGGDGSDTAIYSSASGPITADLESGVVFGASTDTLIDVENIVGSDFDDIIEGDDGVNRLEGGEGDDLVNGRQGDDDMDGGPGFDTADYSGATGPVSVNLEDETASGADGDDSVVRFEAIVGSEFNDTLIGTEGENIFGLGEFSPVDLTPGGTLDNLIEGGGGNDTIFGLSGNDIIRGGPGDDLIAGGLGSNTSSGGPGNDTVDYLSAPNGVFVDLISGEGNNSSSGP